MQANMKAAMTMSSQFDGMRPGKVYRAGEAITGSFTIDLQDPLDVKHITCTFAGFLPEDTDPDSPSVVSLRDVIYPQFEPDAEFLSQSQEQQNETFVNFLSDCPVHTLSPGRHQLPFSVVIPAHLPPSAQKVEYYLEAWWNAPWNTPRQDCRVARATVDVIESEASVYEQMITQSGPAQASTSHRPSFGQGSLGLTLQADKSVVMSGGILSGEVQFRNETPKNVASVQLFLRKKGTENTASSDPLHNLSIPVKLENGAGYGRTQSAQRFTARLPDGLVQDRDPFSESQSFSPPTPHAEDFVLHVEVMTSRLSLSPITIDLPIQVTPYLPQLPDFSGYMSAGFPRPLAMPEGYADDQVQVFATYNRPRHNDLESEHQKLDLEALQLLKERQQAAQENESDIQASLSFVAPPAPKSRSAGSR